MMSPKKISWIVVARIVVLFLTGLFSGAVFSVSCPELDGLLKMPEAQLKGYLEAQSSARLISIKKAANICRERNYSVASTARQSNLPDEAEIANAEAVNASTLVNAIDDELGLKEFNFAVGFAVMRVSGGDVKAATIDNGVVRVTDIEQQKLGVWLSTNSYIDTWGDDYRVGWFLGAQLGGDDKILNALATGVAISSLRPPNNKKGNAPLVLQLGWGWTRVQKLADGYVDGQAPPAGASQVLLKKTTQDGPVLMISYSFF